MVLPMRYDIRLRGRIRWRHIAAVTVLLTLPGSIPAVLWLVSVVAPGAR